MENKVSNELFEKAAADPEFQRLLDGYARDYPWAVKREWKKGGVAAGKCSATSAQGALNVATHGNWKGTWSSTYHEYFITGILGDNETGKKAYWGLYVNGKAASKGACDVKLKNGDKVLFKVTKS